MLVLFEIGIKKVDTDLLSTCFVEKSKAWGGRCRFAAAGGRSS